MKIRWNRLVALCLVVASLIGAVTGAGLNYDLNGDGKINVWDLQTAVNEGQDADEKEAALDEALGGGDELHKNEKGQWEIWSPLGLYNMVEHAQAGDTFVLMQDIDMGGITWEPVENFKGTFEGQMHSISNMKITESANGNMGFFGSIAEGGSVNYLNIKNMNLIASSDAVNIGILAGTCSGTIDGSTGVGFVTDNRTALPGNVYIGGMVGKMLGSGQIISKDVNKLPKDSEETIYTISAKLGTRLAALTDSTYTRIVGIVGDGADAVDAGTILQDMTGTMVDPNAIAWVTNGDVTVYPHSLSEILENINADGNSVVTLQADLSHTTQIVIPYSCTIDCNGYTIATNPNSGNCLNISAAGSENQIFTVKNGTIKYHTLGVRVNEGAVVASNMTFVGYAGACVGIYDPTASYSSVNMIENSTLLSMGWGCVAFNKASTDFTSTGITIKDSNLISSKEGGNDLFVKNSTATAGTVTFGNNVNLYTYGTRLTNTATLAGIDPVKLEGTASVEVAGTTYEGLNHWTTDESVISTEVIAEVTNGSTTVQVTNVTDMLEAIAADGNTQIKLVKEIVRNSTLSIPYSCTIDLNGYSITNASGNALTINGVGTANKVTTIKNGTLNHGILGVRVNTGSINLSNLNIYGTGSCSYSVGFYDPDGQYRADNRIDGCTIYNPNTMCIMYNVADEDFHETGVSISNTKLISAKSYAFGVYTSRMSGIIDLGSGVEIYSPKSSVANSMLYRFEGKLAARSEQNSVTVNGTTVTGVKHWSTDIEMDTINVLLIGNSLSTTIPQELYYIATNAGYRVNIANIYYPGCKSWQHWEWLNNDTPNYQYRHQSEMGDFIRRGDMSTSKNALEDMEWDYIVYQDWFMPDDASTLEQLYECHQEDAYNMMQYLKTNYPNAKHFYYQHWAWAVGRLGTETVEAQTEMWERINTASTKFAEDNGFVLIPCGAAYQMARADERIGDTLCQDDKLHDDGPGGGQYLNGCVFFETIFKDSCIGDTWRASNGPSEEKHLILQEIAHATVAQIHGEDYVK